MSLFPSDSLEGCLTYAECSDDSASRLRPLLTDPTACVHFVETAECDELEAHYHVDDVCVRRPDLGQPCNPDTSSCRRGQVCAEGICVEVGCTLDVGEPCQGYACAFRSACDPTTHRCLSEPGLGEPCVVGCKEPYECDMSSELCVEPRLVGAGCRSSWDCSTGFCDRDYAPYCEPELCSIPVFDEECGVCAEPPTRAACDDD